MTRRHLVLGAVWGILAVAGCASSEELLRRAREHDARADRYAQEREYTLAAREQEGADRLRRQAGERRADERRRAMANPPLVTPPPPAIPPTR